MPLCPLHADVLRGFCTPLHNDIVGLGQSYLDPKWPDDQATFVSI